MSAGVWFAIVIAAALVAVCLYLINLYGPRVFRRQVHCPEKDTDAVLRLEQKEGSFAALEKPDVVACTLLPGAVDCDKACLNL